MAFGDDGQLTPHSVHTRLGQAQLLGWVGGTGEGGWMHRPAGRQPPSSPPGSQALRAATGTAACTPRNPGSPPLPTRPRVPSALQPPGPSPAARRALTLRQWWPAPDTFLAPLGYPQGVPRYGGHLYTRSCTYVIHIYTDNNSALVHIEVHIYVYTDFICIYLQYIPRQYPRPVPARRSHPRSRRTAACLKLLHGRGRGLAAN